MARLRAVTSAFNTEPWKAWASCTRLIVIVSYYPIFVGTLSCGAGWAPGLRRRSSEVSMLSGSPGPAEAAAARAQKRKFDSRCSDAHCRIELQNRKCRCGPHVWSRGPVVFLARANIETLPTGGGEHKTRRRRRPQRGGEHNHDPGQRCRRQGG